MLRFTAIALLTLAVAACGRTELAYRNADRLLGYYTWKTVHASAAQRDDWQPVLQATLRHHRERELPLVVAYLDLATRLVRETEASPGAECLVDGALLLYQRHARLAAALAAPLLAQLDADQIRHFAEHRAQRQKDAVKRYRDPDPQRRQVARQRRITERIEKWTGKLNDGQRRQIRDALERMPDMSADWLAYREQRSATLLAMLGRGADQETLRDYLEGWWVRRDGTDAETRRSWAVARQEFIRLMDELAATLTDRQRTRVQKRLDDMHHELTPFLPGQQQAVDLHRVPACHTAPS